MLSRLCLLWLAASHPLHSSSATLAEQPDGHATLSVRIFTDDLIAVAPGGDSAVAAYVRQHVTITTRTGQPVALVVTAIERDGDLTQVNGVLTAPGGLRGARVRPTVLWERYHDQVNLLRASIGGRSTTLVFANGDPSREVT